MKRTVLWVVILVLVIVVISAVNVSGQDCGYPGCQHFMPPRTPEPATVVFLPLVAHGDAHD